MRRLSFLPFPFILLACGDGGPVDPAVSGDLDPLMATVEEQEVEAPMMVPFVAHGTWWRVFPGDNPEICDEFPVSGYGPISMEANGTHMGLTFWTVDQCWGPPQNPDGSYLRLSVARAGPLPVNLQEKLAHFVSTSDELKFGLPPDAEARKAPLLAQAQEIVSFSAPQSSEI